MQKEGTLEILAARLSQQLYSQLDLANGKDLSQRDPQIAPPLRELG